MANIINADDGVISGVAGIKTSADTSGELNIQTNGVTAISIAANQVVSFPATVGINFNGQIQFEAGTALIPAISTVADTNTGIYFPAADTIAFTEGGVESARFDSSGNLLVGATSGSERIYAATASGNCYVSSNRASKSTGQVAFRLGGGTSGTDWIFYQPINSDTLTFFGNSQDRMTLDTSGNLSTTGNISVGFTGGVTRLGVRGPMYVPAAGFKELGSFFGTDSQATGNGAGITLGGVYSGTNVTAFAQVAGLKENSTDNNYAGYLAFYSRPNGDTLIERARITAAGNFGIGTASPAYPLEVNGGSSAGFMRLASTANPTGFDMGVGGTGDATAYIYNRNNTPLLFATNNTERARIASNGDFGIGTSAPAFKLDVSAAGEVISGTATTGSNMRGIRIYNTTTAVTNNAIGLWLATGPHQAGIASFRADAAGGWDTALAFYTHGAAVSGLNDCYERMRITGEGNVLIKSSRISNAYTLGNFQEWIGTVGSTANGASFSLFAINEIFDNLAYDIYVFINRGGYLAARYSGVFGYNGFTTVVSTGDTTSFVLSKTGTLYNETMTVTNNVGVTVNDYRVCVRVWGLNVSNSVSDGGKNLITSSYLTRIK